jgi:hypothetical protein
MPAAHISQLAASLGLPGFMLAGGGVGIHIAVLRLGCRATMQGNVPVVKVSPDLGQFLLVGSTRKGAHDRRQLSTPL